MHSDPPTSDLTLTPTSGGVLDGQLTNDDVAPDAPFHAISAHLAEVSDGCALLADGFEDALIGLAEGWFGSTHHIVALYDLALCLHVLIADGMSEEEAAEYIDFNVTGAYVDPYTPVFALIRQQPIVITQES